MVMRLTSCLAISLFGYLVIFLPQSNSLLPLLSSHDQRRIIEILICSLVLLGYILDNSNVRSVCFNWSKLTALCVLLLFIFAGCSAYLSASPRHALQEICVFSSLVYLSWFTAALAQQYPHLFLKGLISAILLGAGAYMVGFYTGYLASFLESMPLKWPEPFFGFPNIRSFNQYQLWTLALLYLPVLGLNSLGNHHKYALFIILVFWWVLLFVSASRGVLLAWLLALLATAIVYRQYAWAFLRLQSAGLALGLAAYALLFYIVPLYWKGGILLITIARENTNDRLYLWNQAWQMIKTHPWFGVGPMHYAWYPNEIAAHPHNSVLQLAAEWGIPSTILMLLLLIYGGCYWLKRFNVNGLKSVSIFNQQLVIVLFFTIVANAIYSLVDGVIVMPLSQIMLAVIIGLMLRVYIQESNPESRSALKSAAQIALPVKTCQTMNVYSRVFALIVLVLLEWSVLPEVLPRIHGNMEMIPVERSVIGPRFWQEGGISRQAY